MSDSEILDWASMLGRTPTQQVAVIRNLLEHRNEDDMSVEDRIICRKALMMLAPRTYRPVERVH